MDTRHHVTEPDRRGWHLDKTLSVSHLLTTVAIAGSIFIWASKMEQRILVLETRLDSTTQSVNATQADIKELASIIRDEIRALRIEVREASRGRPTPPNP